MYNVQRVITALFGRVGWKQPTQPEYAIVTEPNTLTKSGRYFQNVYSAVTIKNVMDLQQDADISDEDFNLALEDIQKQAILAMLAATFNSAEVVETVQTFDLEDNLAPTLINSQGKFVGYHVRIGKSQDYATALNSVGLYFDADCTFELQCFIDNSNQPIWAKEVTAVGEELTIVPVDDLVLSYMSNKSRSRSFYIGYFQDDLGAAKAYDESVEVWNQACGWWAETFESGVDGPKFQIPIDPTSKTYGLNLQFTTYRDFTNRIVAQPQLFDEAVGLQVACNVLELILNSTRSNATERITKEQLGDIFRELNQIESTKEKPYAPGLKARYVGEIYKLQKSFLGQPKVETHSLSYAVYQDRSIGD